MNIRHAANRTGGQDLRHLRRLRNLSFSAGSRAGKKGGSVTAPPVTPAANGNLLDLLDLTDPLARPITASDEVYADGGGI